MQPRLGRVMCYSRLGEIYVAEVDVFEYMCCCGDVAEVEIRVSKTRDAQKPVGNKVSAYNDYKAK